jgi:hypothetical protein
MQMTKHTTIVVTNSLLLGGLIATGCYVAACCFINWWEELFVKGRGREVGIEESILETTNAVVEELPRE